LEKNPNKGKRLYNAKGKIGNQAGSNKSGLKTLNRAKISKTRIIRGYPENLLISAFIKNQPQELR